MKFIIFGSKGQLGSEFVDRLKNTDHTFTAYDIDEKDVTDRSVVVHTVKEEKPDVLINCAAYNMVDKAEEFAEPAFVANADAVEYMAEVCAENGVLMVHYSSDYVFDGKMDFAQYEEIDRCNPLGQYGKSKLAGEANVREICDDYLVFRLSWIYGKGTQNFIHKFLGWAKENQELKIANDETSVPTSVETVVDVTMQAIEKNLRGIYHLTNSGYCTRFQWAEQIVKTMGLSNTLVPVSKDSFNLKAPRPPYSAMSNKKISDALGIEIPEWNVMVDKYLKNLG
ncbi:MAG: dTDP-4-dehydrorhamnose reductase [Candidatus Kapabacteria bacterium]|jgi:dTDP-4-dehydrorhamnose reductase|nr:dTDP-4-dehydrorhamnose reductase [Candidatus Kapabacteria bacterium]